MILPLDAQGTALLWALLVGVALSLLYDLGRGLRQTWRGLTIPLDLLFSLLFLLGLLGLSLYTGGLRIYQCLGIICGGGLYFLTLSPPFLRLWRRLLVFIAARFRKIRKQCKKSVIFLRKLEKKLFSTSWKWGTISTIPFLPWKKSAPKRSAASAHETRRNKAAGNAARCRHRVAAGTSCRIPDRPGAGGAGVGSCHRRSAGRHRRSKRADSRSR